MIWSDSWAVWFSFMVIKGIVHPKIKILPLSIHRYDVPNLYDLHSSSKKIYILMKSENFLNLHRQQRNYHIQGPERYKDIVKIVILWNFINMSHKHYSHNLIKLRLNHWCHMGYFNDVRTPFWALTVVVPFLSMQDQKALRFNQKYIHVWTKDELTGLTGLEWHAGE